jgi:ATP-dependent Lon protease
MQENTTHKLRKFFDGMVVRKSLVRDAGLPRLPQYVVEYLIANHVQESCAQSDLKRMREHISTIFPEAETREVVKAALLKNGEVVLIDKAAVTVNLKTGHLVCSLTFLGENRVEILNTIVDKHPRLLTGGLWGSFRLKYIPGATPKAGNRLIVVGVLPFQADCPSQEDFGQRRAQFTTAEWIDILLTSVGYETTGLSPREKLLYLTRLIPAVESNLNIMELGPRQTGKTFLLRNVSPSVYTASGANVSAASLFANVTTGTMGILGSYKIVQLDEIANTRFDDVSTISMLKDFMESGQFARGGKTYSSDASMVLAGNIDVQGDRPDTRYGNLFDPLPLALRDTAFLDRIHGYLPGWEVPKITPTSISQGYGLVVDYLGQVLGTLRTRDRRDVAHKISLPSNMTKRDVVAIEKIVSGLVKLVYPHDQYTEEELRYFVNFAAELRQRVNNELAKMAPGEFSEKDFSILPVSRLAVMK